jgi:beta-lactamase superfamily II metal-dependent hydrolase
MTNPPHPDEIELSLFGPGVGECAVVHLGRGQWMVVDSCLDENNIPVAISYLQQMGVDIRAQVKLIIATHWHDDHIRGLGRLCKVATSAQFACSAACSTKEFVTLVAANSRISFQSQSPGLAEFAEILDSLKSRSNKRASPDHWACEGKRLFAHNDELAVEVHAISPSSHTMTDAHLKFARMLPEIGGQICRVPPLTPNSLSVALVVTTPGISFLLGADLEVGSDPNRGWHAVLNSSIRPQQRSSAYKVAHHGSENADTYRIWQQLLTNDRVAVLTPYCKGHKALPSADDINRIKRFTARVYVTAWPAFQKTTQRPGKDGLINRMAQRRRSMHRRPGHIRIRVPVNGSFENHRVSLSDGAKEM